MKSYGNTGRVVVASRGIDLPAPDAPPLRQVIAARPRGPVICPCGVKVASDYVAQTGRTWHNTPRCRALALKETR